MALSKAKKAEIVKKFAKSEKDTGSVEVQVALITEKIKSLTGVLGWIGSIDLIQPSEATNKNRKKKQKNKIVIKNK